MYLVFRLWLSLNNYSSNICKLQLGFEHKTQAAAFPECCEGATRTAASSPTCVACLWWFMIHDFEAALANLCPPASALFYTFLQVRINHSLKFQPSLRKLTHCLALLPSQGAVFSKVAPNPKSKYPRLARTSLTFSHAAANLFEMSERPLKPDVDWRVGAALGNFTNFHDKDLRNLVILWPHEIQRVQIAKSSLKSGKSGRQQCNDRMAMLCMRPAVIQADQSAS